MHMMHAVGNTKERDAMQLTASGTRMWEKAVLSVYKNLLPKATKHVNPPMLRADNLLPGSRAAIERMAEYASKGLCLFTGNVDNTPEVDED